MAVETAIGGRDTAMQLDAGSRRCKEMQAHAKGNPACCVCGARPAHIHIQRGGTWRSWCAKCNGRGTAARTKAPAPAVPRLCSVAALAPYYERWERAKGETAKPAATATTARRSIFCKITPFYRPADRPAEWAGQTAIRECLCPGAFTKAIGGNRITMDIDHNDRAWPIASQESGTLRLWEEPDGLWCEASVESAIADRVARGEIVGCSFTRLYSDGEKSANRGLHGFRPINMVRSADLVSVTLSSRGRTPLFEGTRVLTAEQFAAERGAHVTH